MYGGRSRVKRRKKINWILYLYIICEVFSKKEKKRKVIKWYEKEKGEVWEWKIEKVMSKVGIGF